MVAKSVVVVFLTVALLAISTTRVVEGQGVSDCGAKLTMCAAYLDPTTTPAANCCDAIRQVVLTQLPCLCQLYNSPGLLPALGINRTEAVLLPRRCNLPNDVSACNALAPGGSPPGGSSSSVPPPGGNRGNAVGRISWIGMPAALLLLSVISSLY